MGDIEEMMPGMEMPLCLTEEADSQILLTREALVLETTEKA